MKKTALQIFLVLLFFLLPLSSWAEIKAGSVEVSPFAGFQTLHTRTDSSTRMVYGLRLGYNITNHWGIEGAYDTVETKANMAYGNVLYNFMPEKSFNPFITAGIGGGHVKPDNSHGYDTVVGNFGAGFKYFFTENVAFRTDVRDVMTDRQNLSVTGGIVIAFGGRSPKPAPAPVVEEPTTTTTTTTTTSTSTTTTTIPVPVVKIILEDVHFDFDKATLTPEAVAILQKNVSTMKENPGVKVEIEGNTCAHGSEKYNMALSERRANAVKEYLEKEGITQDRLTTMAYGETKLEMPETSTPKNKDSIEAKTNRRVHFVIVVQ